jgi:outer membrane cobalamin receptor
VNDRTVRLPGYATVDAAAEVGLPSFSGATAVTLTARVENALGRRYQSVFGYDAPGRVLLLGARATLGR